MEIAMMKMNELELQEKGKEFLTNLIKNDVTGHDVLHAFRVLDNAMKINKKEKGNPIIILLASLLHDADDYKLFPDHKNYENARDFMTKQKINPQLQEKVIHVISQISYKGKDSVEPDTLEGKIVQDADRLDALGAIGIARAFAYGGSHQRPIYIPQEKIELNLNEQEYKNQKTSTIAHFYQKLLLLKDMMNTKEGKKIAQQRHQFLVHFLKEFYLEINEIPFSKKENII